MKFTMSVYPSLVFIHVLIYIFTFYATPQYKYPPSGVMKFTILRDPSWDIIILFSVCFMYALE